MKAMYNHGLQKHMFPLKKFRDTSLQMHSFSLYKYETVHGNDIWVEKKRIEKESSRKVTAT